MSSDDRGSNQPPRRTAGLLQIASAVFWAFFGVRKQQKLRQDAATIKPVHIVIAGVVGAVLFVLILLVVVRLIVSSATQ